MLDQASNSNDFSLYKPEILGVPFDLISYEDVIEIIKHWHRNAQRQYITLTNPYGVMLCQGDPELMKAMQSAGMALPDGVGIIIAATLLGYPHCGRVTGPMLMLKICEMGRESGYRHYLYGGGEGVANTLADKLLKYYPGLEIAGTYSPPFRPLTKKEDTEITRLINAAKPDIVWVGLGCPKQEKWMNDHLGKIEATAMIGVGAAFDFHSEKIKWAPRCVRRMGLEWIYRTAREPIRVGPKTFASLVFVAQVLELSVKKKLKLKGS